MAPHPAPPAPADRGWLGVQAHFERLLQEDFFNRRVQSIVDLRLADRLPRLLERYVDHSLPGLVSKQLLGQVPKFLDQNAAMKAILEQQTQNMTRELDRSARDTLDRISNEPQYHDVRQAYIRSIDGKFQNQLEQQNNSFDDNMKNRLEVFDSMETRMASLEMWNKITSVASIGLACGWVFTIWKK
jgi:hypothetical protein